MAVALTAFVLTGCGASPGTGGSGIRGTIHAVPACPAEIEPAGKGSEKARKCPKKAHVPTGLAVEARSSRSVARTRAAGDRFSFELPPGRYELQVFWRGGAAGPPKRVVVERGKTTRVTLRFDTGVR
jgi:hypothetical protein